MRQFFISALVLGVSTVGQASITFPTEDTSWPVGQENTIQWDTAGVQAPINMYLAPGGSTDTSSAIQIASGVENTGSLSWTPDSTMALNSASVIAVDATNATIISQTFIIIINKGNAYHQTATAHQGMLTTHTTISTWTSYQTVTSIIATEIVHTLTYIQTLHTTPVVFYNTSIATSPVFSTVTTNDGVAPSSTLVTTPLGTAPSSAANGTFVAPTATTGAPQGQFTGAAGHLSVTNPASLLAGALAGLFALALM